MRMGALKALASRILLLYGVVAVTGEMHTKIKLVMGKLAYTSQMAKAAADRVLFSKPTVC